MGKRINEHPDSVFVQHLLREIAQNKSYLESIDNYISSERAKTRKQRPNSRENMFFDIYKYMIASSKFDEYSYKQIANFALEAADVALDAIKGGNNV